MCKLACLHGQLTLYDIIQSTSIFSNDPSTCIGIIISLSMMVSVHLHKAGNWTLDTVWLFNWTRLLLITLNCHNHLIATSCHTCCSREQYMQLFSLAVMQVS